MNINHTSRPIPTLGIVVPCYNEEEVLPATSQMMLKKIDELISLNKISPESFILFVNDGSEDSTWQIIENLSKKNSHFKGLSLSRNRGHQNALLAGLMEGKNYGDILISIDADGQDDINAMNQMLDEYEKGADIVYGVRKKRDTDTFFKKYSAESFYKLLSAMGVEVVYNHADYRLTDKKVLNAFENFEEVNLFLRGMFPLVGFKDAKVYYDRHERIAGESHYPLSKMLGLAFDGITSLSIKPIRMITLLGIISSCFSFIMIIYAFYAHFARVTIPGWTSILCIVCLMGGIQLISLGVIGEYVGKIYMETKKRPRYILDKKVGFNDETNN